MAKYKLKEGGVTDTETGREIPNSPCNRRWKEYQEWLEEGNEPDPQYTQEELSEIQISDQIKELNKTMIDEISVPLECEVNGKTYFMDCKLEDSMRLKGGIDLAELLGETTIDIVDYHNKVQTGVSLEDALEICKMQAKHFRSSYYKRSEARQTLLESKKQ
jgi:hypothetical protein